MKKYICALIALTIFIPVFWGGVVFTFLEGPDARIGICLFLVSILMLYVSNKLIKNRCNYSLLQILTTNLSLSTIQSILLGLTCIVLINYGTEYFEEFSRQRYLAGLPEELGILDPETDRRASMNMAYEDLGDAIVQYGAVLLLLLVPVIQFTKYRRATRLVEQQRSSC